MTTVERAAEKEQHALQMLDDIAAQRAARAAASAADAAQRRQALDQQIGPVLHQRARETRQALHDAEQDLQDARRRLATHSARSPGADVQGWARTKAQLAAEVDGYQQVVAEVREQHQAAASALQGALARAAHEREQQAAAVLQAATTEEYAADAERVQALDAARQAAQTRLQTLQADAAAWQALRRQLQES